MKKKILLSVFAIVGIMAANKSFAQYANHDNHNSRVKSHVIIQREKMHDIRDIRNDQERINYILNKISLKKGELRTDLVRGNWSEYRADKVQLKRLNVRLADARADLAKDTREAYGNHTASRF